MADSLTRLVERGDLAALQTRLSSGANPNESDGSVAKGWTPLMEAAYTGNVAAARILLEAGAAIDAKTEFGKTALDVALASGKTQVAELLRGRGAKGAASLEVPELKSAPAITTASRDNSGGHGQSDNVSQLISNLKDPDSNMRQIAAAVLVKIGTPAVHPLIAALKDPDSHVRFWAADALGEIKDPRAVEPLIAAWKDPDYEIRWGGGRCVGRNQRPPSGRVPDWRYERTALIRR
ncbi:MAG: HEAT repeat domain-containing protein [Terriglobia bacterium]